MHPLEAKVLCKKGVLCAPRMCVSLVVEDRVTLYGRIFAILFLRAVMISDITCYFFSIDSYYPKCCQQYFGRRWVMYDIHI